MSDCQKTRILLLSANPKGTSKLRLDEEMREIKEGLKRSKQRDQYSIETAEAVRPRDIHRALLEYEPNIVHFSGHGAGEEGLVLEDETGDSKLVDAEALAKLFKLFADQIECVVLNACYSEVQAQAITRHINHVIGMSQAIKDRAAIEFAVGFYDALGAGRPVEFAYQLGCTAIRMAGIPENLTPQLLTTPPPPPVESKPPLVQPNPSRIVTPPLSPPAESTPKPDGVELRSERGVNYTTLRDLLSEGKWKEADQETADRMLEVANRQEQGWLDVEDIDNFPCEDLRTIDQLWVHYSKGRFGFSVQKDIYISLGGIRHDDKEVWKKFGDEVGWRKKGGEEGEEWLWSYYEDLSFKLQDNTARGQLPVSVYMGFLKGLGSIALHFIYARPSCIPYEDSHHKRDRLSTLYVSVRRLESLGRALLTRTDL